MDLYELLSKSKNDDLALEKIITMFEPKIKKSLSLTTNQNKDDLSQELKYKLITSIKQYDVNSTPGFWEIYNKSKKKVV